MTKKTVPAVRDAPMTIYVRRVEPRRHLGVALPEKLGRYDYVHDLNVLESDVAGENGGGRYKGRVYDQMDKKAFLGVHDFTIGWDPLIDGLPIEPAPRKPGKKVTAGSPEPQVVKARPVERLPEPSPRALRRRIRRSAEVRQLRAEVAALARASDRARNTVPERERPRPRPRKAGTPTATATPPAAVQGDSDTGTKQPAAFQIDFVKALVSARQRKAKGETELAAVKTELLNMLATAQQEDLKNVARAAASGDVTTPFTAVASLDKEAMVLETVSAARRRDAEAMAAIMLGETASKKLAAEFAGHVFLQTVAATHRRHRPRRRGPDPRHVRIADNVGDIVEMLLFGRTPRDQRR